MQAEIKVKFQNTYHITLFTSCRPRMYTHKTGMEPEKCLVSLKCCFAVSKQVLDTHIITHVSAAYTFPPSYLWYRGRSYTDSNGRYDFEATYPGVYSGRPIPHVHYKVTHQVVPQVLLTSKQTLRISIRCIY